jgi:hypothetical protein
MPGAEAAFDLSDLPRANTVVRLDFRDASGGNGERHPRVNSRNC